MIYVSSTCHFKTNYGFNNLQLINDPYSGKEALAKLLEHKKNKTFLEYINFLQL